MAELANPLYWGARAIGFDAFWWLAAVFDGAQGSFAESKMLSSCAESMILSAPPWMPVVQLKRLEGLR